MRAQMTITDLDQERWDYLQRNVRAEYKIPEGTTHVCLTFSREAEERHVELPLVTMIGLLTGLILAPTFAAFTAAVNKINKATEERITEQDEEDLLNQVSENRSDFPGWDAL